MTPDPTPSPGQEPEAPPATSPGSSWVHIVAIAAAVAGGGLVTLLVMTGRPAAREESAAVRSAAAVATPHAASSAPSTPVPVWSSRNQGRWVSNHRKSAAFESQAIQPVAVWMKQVRPTLVVRCMDKRTDVFVYTDSAARIEEQDENHTVRVAFDDGAGTHERWPDSVEHDALFAPDGRAMVRQLLGARQMRFTFSPHNAAPVTSTFDVAGLGELLTPIAKRCGR
jgi:Type VI secretion system VasI, EvfG, VC_A0118